MTSSRILLPGVLSFVLFFGTFGSMIFDSTFTAEATFHYVTPENNSPDYWPTDGWRFSTPEEQEMDSNRLQNMIDYIESNSIPIHSVIVLRHGYIVLEKYPTIEYNENMTHLLYSVTKSFTSSLIGIAIDKEYIANVSQRVLDFFPNRTIGNLDERKERMTLEHLLTMRSGMEWDEWNAPFTSPENDVWHLYAGPDGLQYALNLSMVAEPGTLWHYNTGVSHILSGIIQETTGMRTIEFANKHLFGPLGIHNVIWGTDRQGVNQGGFDLRLRPRDMAKFGLLYLNNGTWESEQIVSTDWVAISTSAISILNNNEGYGYQWWTLPKIGVYFAAGLYGQFIFVVPEFDLVVVFTSGLSRDASYPHPQIVSEFIIPAVMETTPITYVSEFFKVSILFVIVTSMLLTSIYGYLRHKLMSKS
ncbi:MAG: serine hydrolase domain-containing protein [Candidatus Heimdallarchaeota archaeon]